MERYFLLSVIIHFILFLMVLWSIVFPENRIWPPPRQKSWQYFVYWCLFYIGIGFLIYFILFTWDTWVIPKEIRFFIGLPLILVGSSLSVWSIYILGIKNTNGLHSGFVEKMPYRISRNPMYVGDIMLLFGLILFVNSLQSSILCLLAIFIFIIMPISEEQWLEEKYGEEYLQYKNRTSRFL